MSDVEGFRFYQARPCPLISLTPMIDVVFILLLFFMLASHFSVETSLSVQSSSHQTSLKDPAKLPSSLRILENQQFVLDGELLDSAALTTALSELQASDAGRALSISIVQGIQVQELLDLIALAESIGLTRVTMESIKP